MAELAAREAAGWALLALLTVAILGLALFRPTDPRAIVNEIRLAAGFDRYQAARDEGDRLYGTAVAEIRRADPDDREAREAAYPLLERAVERFRTARGEAEGFYEDQAAQIRMGNALGKWARELYRDGTNHAWYRRNDVATLRKARDLVDEALALPNLTGSQRTELEALGEKIDRAITPWPIL